MCGLAGFVDFNFSSNKEILDEMIYTLNYRGPNDMGAEIYSFKNSIVGFAQSRLSIIDLSESGHQPMNYLNLTIVFNGEIYNFKEIRKELENLDHIFNSKCDTEVILHAYMQWGIDSVNHFIGMFAIILLDREKDLLVCFNDRAGVKPLYYYYQEGLFLFASELKAFHKHPKFKKEIDLESLSTFFEKVNHGHIPAPNTIFKNTWKLEQGTRLELNLTSKEIAIFKYWDISTYYHLPKLNLDYGEAKTELSRILESAFNYRMVSDVPVGLFLSSGYDSTAIAAILQKDKTERLKTFTIGFPLGHNEIPFARKISQFIGTDHTELFCSIPEVKTVIKDLPYYYDEPFADSSAIPTILVSQLASKTVTVALSGDGGDELFAGYSSYNLLAKRINQLNYIPDPLKSKASKILYYISECIPVKKYQLKHKINGIAGSLNSDIYYQASELIKFSNSMPSSYLKHLFLNTTQKSHLKTSSNVIDPANVIEIALISDFKNYLQNDILTKIDRATMSVSLEGREPMLDHRIAEFAAQLPIDYKYDGITSKRILKDIVHDYLPKEMMNRPKSGFSLPIYSWLRSDLAFLIDEYLSNDSLAKSGLFNIPFISLQISLFKKNKLHYQPFIWKLIMFQMWYFRWME